MMTSLNATIFACAGMLVLSACAPVREVPPENWAKASRVCPAGNDNGALAGAWLYEEQGYIDTLRLDERGNGTYEWQDGRISTSCLDKQDWRGTWKQAESEGGFEIKLSKAMTAGEGRRWFTRIGRETKAGEPGSTFQIKRIGAVGQVSAPPTGQEAARR